MPLSSLRPSRSRGNTAAPPGPRPPRRWWRRDHSAERGVLLVHGQREAAHPGERLLNAGRLFRIASSQESTSGQRLSPSMRLLSPAARRTTPNPPGRTPRVSHPGRAARRAGCGAAGRRAQQQHARGRIIPDVDSWIEAIRTSRPAFQETLDWVSCFALAVNEENAASAGWSPRRPTARPASSRPCCCTISASARRDERGVEPFLLTASEVGCLFKKGATISAAMGGCQAEIGVSTAMAAAGLAQCLGGSAGQVADGRRDRHGAPSRPDLRSGRRAGADPLHRAEHDGRDQGHHRRHLALASDPADAKVSLDAVIRTMWETAQDMSAKYKETAEGGLALQIPVNLTEC